MSSLPMKNEPDQSLQNSPGISPRSKVMLFLRWWYYLTAPPEVPESAKFTTREQVRRGRVASLMILGTLCSILFLSPIIVLAFPVPLNVPWVFASAAVSIFCCLLAIPMNRARHVILAGILLIVAVDMIVGGVILSERDGLNPLFLSMFDLLVVCELIAASILAPASVFGVALINIILIVLVINFQPRSMMWDQMIMSEQVAYSLLALPITLYLVVATVAYLWIRSALNALQRADRAELIAELKKREVEQKQQLEREIEQILMAHVRVANGDFNARAPTYQDNVLWQIGIALNNLLSRFKVALQAERSLQRVTEEIAQLRVALRYWQSGQPLQWYPTREILLNPLVSDLKRALTIASVRSAFTSSPPMQEMQPRRSLSLPGSVPSMQSPHDKSDMRTNATRSRDVSSETLTPGQ